jgi:tetratricopeptide (TPR) repeat protein
MPIRLLTTLLVCVASLTAGAGRQALDDPQLQAAVQQFFGMQEAEDVDGYLALWSKTAKRPTPEQLKFVFESGDDKFSGIAIVGAAPAGERVRVRVAVTRERTSPARVPGGVPRVFRTTSAWSLLYVREAGEWKLVKEGPAVDALAESLMEAATAEEREALLASSPDLVTDQLIVALSRLAGQFAQQGAHAAARAGFERSRDVARLVGNKRLEGEALQNLANAMYFLRSFQEALQVYEERLALERARDDENGIAGSLLGIATVRYALADYSAAHATYREALAIQERLGDDGAIATTLISTGNVLYLQGDFPGSIADYTRSRDLYKRTNNPTGEADALEGMGRVLMAQGDYPAALAAFDGVLAEARIANNRNDQGTALLSIGDVHFRLGNLESSRTALDEARTHFEATKHLASTGRAWQALAMTDLAAGRFSLAEDEYRKSGAICGAAQELECVASATVGLAFTQTVQDKFAEGIASYKKGVEAFTKLSRREYAARGEVGLSHALVGSGDFAAAVDAAARAKVTAEAISNDDVLWRALVAEAGALRRLRERPKALAAARTAVTTVDRLLEAAKVRPAAPVSRDTSAAFAALALLQAEDGDAAAAFESVERMRAHDLRVIVGPGERDVSRGMTDAEREEERALAFQMVSLHAQISRERGLPKPDAVRVARLEKAAVEATEKRAAQQQRLFERLPELRIWRGLAPAAMRDDVANLLPDASTVLMQFAVGEDALLIVVARRGQQGVVFTTHVEAASRKVLADRVAKLMQPATLRDTAAWRQAALELIPGLTAVFGGATRAILIPHEVLWRVPFEALPAEPGYLGDSTTVVYAPSVTALVRAPARAVDATAPELLVAASAAPLGADVRARLAQTSPDWIIRTPESAAIEIEAIAGREPDPLRTAVVDSAQATEAAVRERLPAARVIHVAAPFRINGASPMFSSFLFAPDPANDAALETREIMNLELQARLAVVSDGSAMTMRDAADESAVIAWAWRASGVPAIVMPRWPSEELLATQMLTELHARLRAGDTAAAALQAARAKIRAEKSQPFYWAGWMLVGQ